MTFNLWLTGLSGSGKSTLASRVSEFLTDAGVAHEHIDPDVFRKVLIARPSYSDEERESFRTSVLFIASMLNRHGVSCVLPLLSSQRTLRETARTQLPNFIEVYVKCPLEVCMQRDPKGMYARSQDHTNPHIVGRDLDYEEPEAPDLIVETDKYDIEFCTDAIVSLLRRQGYLKEQATII